MNYGTFSTILKNCVIAVCLALVITTNIECSKNRPSTLLSQQEDCLLLKKNIVLTIAMIASAAGVLEPSVRIVPPFPELPMDLTAEQNKNTRSSLAQLQAMAQKTEHQAHPHKKLSPAQMRRSNKVNKRR